MVEGFLNPSQKVFLSAEISTPSITVINPNHTQRPVPTTETNNGFRQGKFGRKSKCLFSQNNNIWRSIGLTNAAPQTTRTYTIHTNLDSFQLRAGNLAKVKKQKQMGQLHVSNFQSKQRKLAVELLHAQQCFVLLYCTIIQWLQSLTLIKFLSTSIRRSRAGAADVLYKDGPQDEEDGKNTLKRKGDKRKGGS